MDEFKRVIILAHPLVDQALIEATRIARYLDARGLETAYGLLNDDALRQRVQAREFDLVISLGGDGTVLRAGHLCAPYNVPILAVNHGRFGFLIEVVAGEWPRYLDALLAGDYWYEDRMMLRATLWRGRERIGCWEVLNEIVIGRGMPARPVHLVTSLDGKPLTTYVADALIAATPTGSTAYALAAGGPILPPSLRNILLLPVAPHLSVDRAIVLDAGQRVSIQVLSDHQTVMSVDGQEPLEVMQGDRVDVNASEYSVRIVRFQGPDYFYRNILSLMDQNPSAGVA